MPNFTKYEPYPNSNFGAGDFTDDQGRTMPLYDPVEAQRLTAPPEDLRTAQAPVEPPPEGAYARDFAAGTGGGAAAPMAPTAAPALPAAAPEPTPPPAGKQPSIKTPLTESEMQAFDTAAKEIGGGITGEDLAKVSFAESGLDHTARHKNKDGSNGAGGMFQMDKAHEAAFLKGTGFDDITKMPREAQILRYPSYIKDTGGKPPVDGGDLYVKNAAPKYAGQPDDTLIAEYNANDAFGKKVRDENPKWIDPKTGQITVGSLKRFAGFGGGKEPVNMDDPVARAGAQLYAPMAGTPGMAQTSTTHRENQGVPYTQEQQDQVRALHGGVNAADDAAMAPVIEAQKQIQLQQIAAEQEIKQAKDKAATTEALSRTNYEAGQARVQAGVDAVEQDKQPPPFTQRNIFAGILAAIAQGMGTYSAAINHTENFAMKAINEAIAQDNQRWQQQHLDKQFKVKEAKDLNSNQWHVFQSDKAEREMQQRKLLDNELEQRMSLAKGADQQRVLGLNKADNLKHYGELDLQLKRAAAGTAETSVTNAYVGPTEGGAPDLETVNKRAEQIVKSGEDPEVVAAARGRAGESGKTPVNDKELQSYAQGTQSAGGRISVDTWERRLKTLPESLGLKFDPKTNAYVVDSTKPDPVARNPLTGAPLDTGVLGEYGRVAANTFGEADPLGKGPMADTRAHASTQLHGAAADYVKMISGAQAAEPEAKRLYLQLAGRSREDMAQQLTQLLKETEKKKVALAKAFPGAEAAYNRRETEGSTKAAEQDEAPIKETPH